ncbi:MAG: hypothetical protein O2895_04895 [Chloroflexi bacterium]|nr:hypothetical protein [Chloroflexota bacterium]
MLDLGWRWIAILAGALVAAVLLGAAAFVEDSSGAPANLLTEGPGVVTSTAITVIVIDELRRRRERREAQRLRRNRLTRELSHNVSRLVTRHGSSAVVRHRHMSTLCADRPLSTDDIRSAESTVRFSEQGALWLMMALLPRLKLGDMRTEAVQAALADGAYLDVRKKEVVEEPTHAALERIIRDVGRLRTLDQPSDFGVWDDGLLKAIAVAKHSGVAFCDLSVVWLVSAYAYHDAVEDIWQEHVALLRSLLEGTGKYDAPVRQPTTPLGADMEEGIRAEAVTPSEVLYLVSQDIFPFGSRIPEDMVGDTREERIDSLVAVTKDPLKDALAAQGSNVEDEELEALTRSASERVVDEQLARENEGLERIEHPRRRD